MYLLLLLRVSQSPDSEDMNMKLTFNLAIRRTHNGESVSFLFTHAPTD